MDNALLPSGLQSLMLGGGFNQNTDNMLFLSSLRQLSLGGFVNHRYGLLRFLGWRKLDCRETEASRAGVESRMWSFLCEVVT